MSLLCRSKTNPVFPRFTDFTTGTRLIWERLAASHLHQVTVIGRDGAVGNASERTDSSAHVTYNTHMIAFISSA